MSNEDKSKIEPALGSFKSFIHLMYLTNETTKFIVEQFLEKKPKYSKYVTDNPVIFFQYANKAINKKKRSQL